MKLEEYYSEIYKKIKIEKNIEINISCNDFKKEQITLYDDDIIIRKCNKTYSGYGENFVDSVLIFISREKSVFLSLAILHSIFNPEDKKVKIRLNNQYSDIQFIYLDTFKPDENSFGIIYEPLKYRHVPFDISEYEQKYEFTDSFENKISSCLRLEKDFIMNYDEFKARNIFQGFGSAAGTEKLIDLLFDFSLDENPVKELSFENELGFGQLTAGSCEFKLIINDEDCPYKIEEKYDLFFK